MFFCGMSILFDFNLFDFYNQMTLLIELLTNNT